MSMPKIARVADLIRERLGLRFTLSPLEASLASHLRGNAPLYDSLTEFLQARVQTRASQPPPVDPIACKSLMERDHELRIILNRLEFLYKSPVAPTQNEEGEP